MLLARPITVVLLICSALSILYNNLTANDRAAFACQCQGRPVEESLEAADVAFMGRVTKIDRDSGDGIVFAKGVNVKFDVYKFWKGIDTESITIRTGVDKSAGCFAAYSFREGEEYIVFATKNLLSIDTALCDGTKTVEFATMYRNDLTVLENIPTIPLRQGSTENNVLLGYGMMASVIGVGIGGGAVVFYVKSRRGKKETGQ